MNDLMKKRLIAMKSLPIPNASTYHKSGIYLYERIDENGIVWFYCGQAVDIYSRALSHGLAFDRLGISLRKRGYYNENNLNGWKFSVVEFCTKEQLDELEHYYILKNMRKGKQAYNITAGKQGQGKEIFDTRKPSKGYYDGKKQGRKDLAKELKSAVKYLNITPKDAGKRAQAAFEKFTRLLVASDNNTDKED